MRNSREGNAAGRWRDARLLGAGLSCLLFAHAQGEVTYLNASKSEVFENGQNVASTGGKFSKNVEVRVLQVGDRRLDMNEDAFHDPVVVSVFTNQGPSDKDDFKLIPDAEMASPESQVRFALASDIGGSPDMTALDAAASPDFGRMLRPEGAKATRIRVFAPLPEKDNDEILDDKTPELLVMSAVPGVAVRLTPILGGSPDPEQADSLILGLPRELAPSLFERGKTGIEMILGDNPAPQQMCVFGLDLSGDLGLKPGQTVVGYQLDIPAGSSFPIKLVLIGEQAPSTLANFEDGSTQRLGFAPDLLSFGPSPQLDTPPLQPELSFDVLPFQESDQAINNPPVPPPPPPVPTPGVAALLVGAASLLGRRRKA